MERKKKSYKGHLEEATETSDKNGKEANDKSA
jgi:hypothetical protein